MIVAFSSIVALLATASLIYRWRLAVARKRRQQERQRRHHEEMLAWRGPFDPETFGPKKATTEMRKVT